MTTEVTTSDRRRHCQLHLARLRIATHAETAAPLARQVAIQVREATSAIITEAEEAGRAALAATADSGHHSSGETFLWARLVRLAVIADKAVSAARAADGHALRRHVDHFEALTTAIWTVQEAVLPAPDELLVAGGT